MSEHEEFADDLALHALGTLQGSELAALEKHLEECASCRRELEQLRGDMALMALSTAGPKPSQGARQRLLDAIALEPRKPVAAGFRRPWWAAAGWICAAAMAVIAVLLWRDNSALIQEGRKEISELRSLASQQELELADAHRIVEALTTGNAAQFTLTSVKAHPQPQGKAIYVRDRASLIFLASNLRTPPPQKAYELWLIPTSGAPIPAGVFKPDAHGSATVINPPLPAGVEAKAFAITVEPEQGSSTPTMPIVMMGAGE
jgi:anti-sigma-K factor RskA